MPFLCKIQVVFRYISVDSKLVTRNDEFVAAFGADGELGLTGNKYLFAGNVNAMSERHEFPFDPNASSYISTGYKFEVPLQLVGINQVYRVDVTSPRGITFTMVPGTNAMVLPITDNEPLPPPANMFDASLDDNGNPIPSGSAFVRLA